MKRGYLGLYESAYIQGRTQGFKEQLEENGINTSSLGIPLNKMIYVAAFQGGIDKFISFSRPDKIEPIDQFIFSKIEQPNKSDIILLSELVSSFPSYGENENKGRVTMVMSFIFDLIVAMQNDSSVINVSGIPSVDEVKMLFPPEISFPICSIISQLIPTNELLPAPSLSIPEKNIGSLKDLLGSNVFSKYSMAHKELEYAVSDKEKALAEIKKRGSTLLEKGKGILLDRRVSMNILPVLPKVIDAAFGKLPGVFAQIAGDAATKFSDNKRSVIVYQFNDWANEYHNSTITYLNNLNDRQENS